MSDTTELTAAIKELDKKQAKIISMRWNFYRGIMYGLGFFVGGTLIVGGIIYVMSFFDTAPIIGDYVSKILSVVNTVK